MESKVDKNIRINLLAILAYSALTLILTYPAILNISDYTIGWGGDTYVYINAMWWSEKSFLNPNLSFYNNTYLYHPTGVSFAFQDVIPFYLIVAAPMNILFGRIVTYNLLVLSTFILSAFGAYLLVEYLTKDKKAAFLSGFIFSFCPQHLMQAATHLGIASIQWLPFFVLYFLKTVKEGNRKDAVLAAIFLSIASLCAWYNAVYLLLFVGFYIVFNYFNERGQILNRKVIKNLALMGLLSFLLVFPFAYPMFAEMGKDTYMIPSANESVLYSADLMGFFIPSAFHPLLGQYFAPLYKQFTVNMDEGTTYIGYTVIFLVVYYIFKNMGKLGEAKFWVWSAAFFFIMSLGPVLHIGGQTHFTASDITIPLPYSLLYTLPIIQISRVPARLAFMLMLSLAVLVGYGVKELFKHSRGKLFGRINKKDIAVEIIFYLILLEFIMVPYPVHKVYVPEFYKRMAAEKEDYAILEVPLKKSVFLVSDYMYYQTIHEKRLVGGYLSRTPEYAIEFIENTPVISNYRNIRAEFDILNQNLSRIGNSLLSSYNIRYIIIHKKDITREEFAYLENLSRSILNDTPVYDNEELLVYKVKKVQGAIQYMACGDGFYNAERWDDGYIWRWMDNDAKLLIVNMDEHDINANITLSVVSFAKPRRLEVRANSITMRSISVPQQPKEEITILNVTLHHGTNVVEFHTSEELVTISSVLHNNDTRRVGLALSNVSLEVS